MSFPAGTASYAKISKVLFNCAPTETFEQEKTLVRWQWVVRGRMEPCDHQSFRHWVNSREYPEDPLCLPIT